MKKPIKEQVKDLLNTHYAPVIKNGSMRYQLDGTWLTIEYRNVLTADDTTNPKNWKWSLVCAQDVMEYTKRYAELDTLLPIALIDRINIILFDQLRSKQQDINILMSEYNLVKK